MCAFPMASCLSMYVYIYPMHIPPYIAVGKDASGRVKSIKIAIAIAICFETFVFVFVFVIGLQGETNLVGT